MPTYEYRCPNGHEFEIVQKMSDEPGASCPECGEGAERLISAGGGLLFKGDGFYITDYRSKEYKSSAAAESGTASSSVSDGASDSPSGSSPSKSETSSDSGSSSGSSEDSA